MTASGLAPSGVTANADLFGPDPGSNPLAYYAPADPAADIFSSASPVASVAWHAYAGGMAGQCHCDLAKLQGYLDGHVDDLGLAFRLTGDEHERPWPLNPMPIFIGAAEWEQISQGLVQRAELLERVIADIYGPQQLVREGQLPAAVVSGSSNFARRLVGTPPAGGHYLHVYAVDLARGPTGEWRVLADRVRFPVGMGYALENRLAIGRATGGLLASVGVRHQGEFFDAFRQGVASDCQRADPRIALLTPGRFNQSYPEQAHLARHLGFSLVEGRDLTVREDKLYMRTIAGLKRIDALWRWIGTRDIDPMSFDARSQIGVPNLMAAAAGGLVLANWPGAGVVESRAMPAFLPRLAKSLLGEPLRLPNAATWWCGGAQERAHVLENLDQLVVSSAFRRPVIGLADGHTRAGASLSAAERAELERGMAQRPMDYCGQEIVSLSTTPLLVDGRFEPRSFTLRAFLARNADGEWVALQGGFARASQTGDLRTSLMGMGDISTDLCVVDPVAPKVPEEVLQPDKLEVRREQGLLSSQAADNLFWMGRYGERAHQTVRIIRVLIEQLAMAGNGAAASTTLTRLANLLRSLGAVPADSTDWSTARLSAEALGNAARGGSVRALAERERGIAQLLRDRLTRDSWRAIQRTMPSYVPGDIESMAIACDRLVERHAALSGLFADGMSRGPAWRFLDMGMRLERGSMILQAVQALVPGSASANDLSALLDLVDGQSLYRSRYLTMPFIAPVFDMVLLDPVQPRGLAFQLSRLAEHLAAIPPLHEDGMPEPPLRLARRALVRLEGLDARQLDSATLDSLRDDLGALSEAISKRFFLQDEQAPAKQTRLLA
ncbi:MAG: circularly permuted type 2 ATP-grasp protein [Erythrobacter sp.]|nr:circularly permuted type 2 ATP-grasp protein [Erythrobacter sp.]